MNLHGIFDFLVFDWLQAESLNQRVADYSLKTFDAVFDTCEHIAHEK